MKASKILLGIFGVIFLMLALLTVRQVIEIVAAAKGVFYDQLPYNRRVPGAELKILFLGDSTAVGTGASDNRHSTAGYFGQDFPLADITNNSQNGKKIQELLTEISTQTFGKFDLVVIQIGGNDIMKLTPFKNIESDLAAVIERAKTFGRYVVILHSGNVGTAPIFHWPFDAIMTNRSRKVREIYMSQAKAQGVMYVDLFAERKDDLFLKDVKRYYSADSLHPSGDGYRWWYEHIRRTLDQSGVFLKQKKDFEYGI